MPSETTNVIQLEKFKRDHGGDDSRFLVCPKCDGDDFGVICMFASGVPFVASLLCVNCEPPSEIGVLNGVLQNA
jgi:hypothetical protein